MSRLIDVAAVLESMAKALDGTEQWAACEFAVRLIRELQNSGSKSDTDRLDWLEDFFSRYTERSVLRRNFAANLRSVGFRAAIDMARKP